MAECECLKGCIFFNDRMTYLGEGLAELFKKRYCRGDNEDCARHMVFKAMGREMVPPDLYPNLVDRAKAIIAQEK